MYTRHYNILRMYLCMHDILFSIHSVYINKQITWLYVTSRNTLASIWNLTLDIPPPTLSDSYTQA